MAERPAEETADDIEVTFDPSLAGRRAEADGGAAVPGTNFAARQSFAGTLTGRRLSQGEPPWRFLELGELTEKPEGFEHAVVRTTCTSTRRIAAPVAER